MTDFENDLQRLMEGNLPPAPMEGRPADPAQMVEYHQNRAFALDERHRETLALKAAEREQVERHWDRWEQLQAQQQSIVGAVQPQMGAPTVNVYLQFAGYPQPAPVTYQSWDYDAIRASNRREDRRTAAMILVCVLMAIVGYWLVISAIHYAGEQDARKADYAAPSQPVASEHRHP